MRRALRAFGFSVPAVLVFSSIVLSTGAAEIGLRLLGHVPNRMAVNPFLAGNSWAMPDPRLGWVNRPGSYPSIEDGHVMMSFMPDGSRFDPAAKEDTLPTVVVIGCSFTQGYAVADSETYSHLLNTMLPNVRIVNYGAAGYGTYQSLLRLQSYFDSHLKTQPALIVYGMIGDHFPRNVATASWIFATTTSDGRKLIPPSVRINGDSVLAQPWGPVEPWPFETISALVTTVHNNAIKINNRVSAQEQEQVLKELVLRMAALARQHGARFIVAGLAGIPEWFADWASRNRIDLADCQHPGFATDARLHVGGVGHPNGLMHQWWAQCLRERVSSAAVPPAGGALP
jgi:hypothetical protein